MFLSTYMFRSHLTNIVRHSNNRVDDHCFDDQEFRERIPLLYRGSILMERDHSTVAQITHVVLALFHRVMVHSI